MPLSPASKGKLRHSQNTSPYSHRLADSKCGLGQERGDGDQSFLMSPDEHAKPRATPEMGPALPGGIPTGRQALGLGWWVVS